MPPLAAPPSHHARRDPLLTTLRCSAAILLTPPTYSACGRPNASQWHSAEAIFHRYCHCFKTPYRSRHNALAINHPVFSAAALPLIKCQPCSIHCRRFLHYFERAVPVFVGRSESIFPFHFTLAKTQDMKKCPIIHASLQQHNTTINHRCRLLGGEQ